MARKHHGHRHRRVRSGGMGVLLLVAALVVGFFVLRSNPALAANLPAEVRRAIDSIKLPTQLPAVQIPTGLPQLPFPATGQPASGPAYFGTQTKTSGCQAVNALPDSACTPGAIFPDATTDQICQSGYSASVRDVPDSLKDQVYAECFRSGQR